jgi:hypothetical protein
MPVDLAGPLSAAAAAGRGMVTAVLAALAFLAGMLVMLGLVISFAVQEALDD